jgi:type IV secretion system pilin
MKPARTLPRAVLSAGVTALLAAAPHPDRSQLGWVNEVLAHHATATSVVLEAAGSVLALVTSIGQVLDNIRNWIIGILGGLATLFLTIGAARYLMAGGDPGEVERARAAFRSAGFGYALALLAPLIVQILKSIVGA